jgi:hypothetical protein
MALYAHFSSDTMLKSNEPNSISKDALRDEDCSWLYMSITHFNYFQCGIIIFNNEIFYISIYNLNGSWNMQSLVDYVV